MQCRGVRGATTVESNTREAILQETRRLLAVMVRENGLRPEDIGSAIFTVTRDIDAEFPAVAARQLGWRDVPLLCGYEIHVPNSLPHCIRVMLHWNTEKTQQEIVHVYLKNAVTLRPDLAEPPEMNVDFTEVDAWIEKIIGR